MPFHSNSKRCHVVGQRTMQELLLLSPFASSAVGGSLPVVSSSSCTRDHTGDSLSRSGRRSGSWGTDHDSNCTGCLILF